MMTLSYFSHRFHLRLLQMSPWNQRLNDFGKKMEGILHERIENFLGEKIIRTIGKYDKHDFFSPSYDIELKSRQPPWRTTDPRLKSGWVVPSCKFENLTENKKTICFYYFEEENRLFYINYDKTLFSTFKKDRGPITIQEHYYIPEKFWTEISAIE